MKYVIEINFLFFYFLNMTTRKCKITCVSSHLWLALYFSWTILIQEDPVKVTILEAAGWDFWKGFKKQAQLACTFGFLLHFTSCQKTLKAWHPSLDHKMTSEWMKAYTLRVLAGLRTWIPDSIIEPHSALVPSLIFIIL